VTDKNVCLKDFLVSSLDHRHLNRRKITAINENPKRKNTAERILDVSLAPTASGGSGLPKILIADIEGDGGEDIAAA